MDDTEVGTVTITREWYLDLLDAAAKLEALENAGVDDWEWYGDAMEALRDK